MKVTLMMCLNESIPQLYLQKALRKASGWIIDAVTDHNIGISKYNPLAGYIKAAI